MIRQWPIVAAVVLLWLSVALLIGPSMAQNDGHLVYPLDDTYITMAMAKNLAEHGVWGVTRHEFASASSSILWPIVLGATYGVTGTNEIAPLAWNLVWATFVVGLCGVQLRQRGLRPVPLFLALLAIVLLIPLPVLVFIGLEHTLHLLLSLAVITRAAKELVEHPQPSSVYPSAQLLALIALLVATRYEGLFLVLMLSCVWAARKGWRGSVAVASAAAVPVIGYGIISMAHGWHFFPNSILLKGALTHTLRMIVENGLVSITGIEGVMSIIGHGAFYRFMEAPAVLFVLLMILAMEICRADERWSFSNPRHILTVVCGGTSLIHMQFAGVGWLFRYEAYLVALGLFVLLIEILDRPAWSRWPLNPKIGATLSFVGFFCVWALGGRAAEAIMMAPQAARNIYEQQYQMGLFVREDFRGDQVTMGDVGAINFLADVRCLDVEGLASKESFDLKVRGALTGDAIASLSRDSAVAILYDRVLKTRGLPSGWSKIGSWKIPNNVICADATVFFYSTTGRDPAELVTKLRRFGSRLPSDVEQVIFEDEPSAQ